MSKLYVFGIGGTGARVLRALTHLLASGVECKDTIVPVLIDPDVSNGDLTRTVTTMQQYNVIRSHLNYDNSLVNRFFATEIIEHAGFRIPVKDSQNQTFQDFIRLNELPDTSKALMMMLYSEKNLASDMVLGFKGNPNVGSIVLNQFSNTQEFINIANDFNQGDRIFIISSIFGGTGASGFPLLLKMLRTNKSLPNFGYLNEAPIGAITVLPYFKVDVSEDSCIASDSFISKTRSALAYYDKNLGGEVDTLYYIGDNQTAHHSYENNEGGVKQQNNAHLIEMLSAMAILDFVASDVTHTSGQTIYKEFGLENEKVENVIFRDFDGRSKQLIRKPLIQTMLVANYLQHVPVKVRCAQQWSKTYKLDVPFFNSDFITQLSSYLHDFVGWLHEMEDNQLSFTPFSWKSDNLFGIVRGLPPINSIWSFGKNNYQLFDYTLDCITGISKSLSGEQAFIELFYRATSRLVAQKYKI